MKKRTRTTIAALTAMLAFGLCFLFLGVHNVYGNSAPVQFLEPEASGVNVRRTQRAEIDYSNVSDGYVMVRVTERQTVSVRVLITGPNGVQYQYRLNGNMDWEVFPLSGGNGRYAIVVAVQADGNRFAVAASVNVDVELTDEFAPFLRPNQFVNFNRNSLAVLRAAELAYSASDAIDIVTRVYNFVIDYIEYDFQLAATVQSGYVPDLDVVMTRRMGICFDYAALMTAMLRSQGIPTQLVIGYVGDVFHAWISVYTEETGWITDIIRFDGNEWRLLDPTFSSTAGGSDRAAAVVGNGEGHRPTNIH